MFLAANLHGFLKKGMFFRKGNLHGIEKIMHDICAIFVTYIFIKCNTIIKLYTEKKMNSPCFFYMGGFWKSNSPRFPAKKGVKLMENSMERGVKSFQTD